MRKTLLIITTMLPLLLITGCWDFEDANERSMIISVGVDKKGSEITFIGESTLAKASNNSESNNSNSNFYIFSGTGKNFEDARDNLNDSTSYTLFLGFTRAVIFSELYAKGGILPYVNRIDTLYDYRKALIPIVCKNRIADMYKVKIENDIGLGFYLENNISKGKSEGSYYYSTIQEILNRKSLNLGFVLPYVSIINDKLLVDGFAIMNSSGIFEDSISPKQFNQFSGIVLLLNNDPHITINLNDVSNLKNEIVFMVSVSDKDINTNYNKGLITLNLNLKCQAVFQYDYYSKKLSNDEKNKIEAEISNKIKTAIFETIKYSQSLDCDFIGFSQYFNRDYPDIYNSINWNEGFQNAKINIHVNTKFKNGTLVNIDKN